MIWLTGFWQSLINMLYDVLPIIVILGFFQIAILRQSIPDAKRIFVGFLFVLFGLTLFLEGLDIALFPLGKMMAQQLTDPIFIYGSEEVPTIIHWGDYYWVYIFAATLGFSTAIAEPSLMAVSIKANQVSGGAISVIGLRVAVAIGAAIGISLGTFRIVTGTPLEYYIVAGYVVVIIQTYFAPKMIIPLAYDSGGVTTSTVTVPLVTALGLGLATHIPDRSIMMDGFGLIASTCLFTIMTVMGYVQWVNWLTKRSKKKLINDNE